MDCAKSIELLSDFHDGTLEGSLYVEVETHLATCYPCTGIFRDLDTIVLAAMTLRGEATGLALPDEQVIWQRMSIGKDALH
jgi:predicted anti-sigma-YlaC factor YlaD